MQQIRQLVNDFADNIAAQTRCVERGDPKAGNRHADRALHAFNALRAIGDEGRDALATLLSDPRPDVRSTAAAFLLRHRHTEARAVLEEVARGTGIDAFSAGEALKRWDEGVWALDLADDQNGDRSE